MKRNGGGGRAGGLSGEKPDKPGYLRQMTKVNINSQIVWIACTQDVM